MLYCRVFIANYANSQKKLNFVVLMFKYFKSLLYKL